MSKLQLPPVQRLEQIRPSRTRLNVIQPKWMRQLVGSSSSGIPSGWYPKPKVSEVSFVRKWNSPKIPMNMILTVILLIFLIVKKFKKSFTWKTTPRDVLISFPIRWPLYWCMEWSVKTNTTVLSKEAKRTSLWWPNALMQ